MVKWRKMDLRSYKLFRRLVRFPHCSFFRFLLLLSWKRPRLVLPIQYSTGISSRQFPRIPNDSESCRASPPSSVLRNLALLPPLHVIRSNASSYLSASTIGSRITAQRKHEAVEIVFFLAQWAFTRYFGMCGNAASAQAQLHRCTNDKKQDRCTCRKTRQGERCRVVGNEQTGGEKRLPKEPGSRATGNGLGATRLGPNG